MNRVRKYEPGPPITSLDELAECTKAGGYVFMFGHKPMHGRFVRSMQFANLLWHVEQGRVRQALIRDEWFDKTFGKESE